MPESPVTVRVSRRFSAPAERVFDAWLDPALLGRWMFGPAVREEEVVRLSVDARVGGAFSFLVRRGDQEIDHVGEYLELDRPYRLAFTWGVTGGDSSRVSVRIERLEDGCELTLTHELHPDWGHFAGRAEQGWAQMLDALVRAL